MIDARRCATFFLLELRLEVSKTVCNIAFKFLERLKDRQSIIERYRSGDVHLHWHVRAGGWMHCCTVISHSSNFGQIGIESRPNGNPSLATANNELPMLVLVGEVAEAASPVASHVRLQTLDCGYMAGVDAFEKGSFAASIEVLFRVHNRKLRAALHGTGIQFGQLKNEIIQGASKIVANFPHENSDAHPEKSLGWPAHIYDVVRRIRIEIEGDGISLSLENVRDFDLQVSKVFACPPFSLETAIKRVNAVIDHDRAFHDVGRRMASEY